MKSSVLIGSIAAVVFLISGSSLMADEEERFGGLERWQNVQWVEHPSNDGDSFYVEHQGERHLLRLYYVDAPETSAASETDARRVRDQTRYFGLTSHRDTVHFGEVAEEFAREVLSEPFTVYTARATAPGRSVSRRMYAFIETAEGEDFAAQLVAEGLARAYGMRRRLPDGRSASDGASWYSDLESGAMLERRGIWKASEASQLVASRAQSREELAELREIHDSIRFPAEPIDINEADFQDLTMLPGVGPVTARNIEKHRPFDGPEDLLRVPRITEHTLSNMHAHLKWDASDD